MCVLTSLCYCLLWISCHVQGLSWGKPADWGEVGWVGGVGGMQGRENPLQTPHLHVMEHLQNRDLPPERRAIDSRHNREIVPAADAPSSATKSAAGRCRGAADGAQNAAEKTRRDRGAACRGAETYRAGGDLIPPGPFGAAVFTWAGCPLQ